MIPKFSQESGPLGASLLCPGCGAANLHHDRVETFDRGEDAPEGLRTIVSEGTVQVSRALDGNPSPRRDGVLISFWCELCSAKPQLRIAQHKGETYMTLEP